MVVMTPNMTDKKGLKNTSNEETKKKVELEIKNENLKPEVFETFLPTTISYHSNCLPDAIFLTTSNGQLITTSTINYSIFLTDITSSSVTNKQETKKDKDEEHLIAAAATPSASQLCSSATSKEENIFSPKFPFLTTSSQSDNNITKTFAPVFSLSNPLLAPNLAIPIYNTQPTTTGVGDSFKNIFVTTPQAKPNPSKSKESGNSESDSHNMATSRGRKRTAQSRLPAKLKEPAAVARRNARERRRVKMVNDGFLRLRRHVPTDPKNKKLSKVKTLRLAIEYIHHLQHLLQVDNCSQQTLQLVANISQVSSFDDIDGGNAWLNTEAMNRVNREMDEDIFQTIDPARLRTNYTDYITR
ncbi:N-myc protein [Hydra vulgaris]|uniref:N-myc protein n=1 Tax=Hydra vulgaris TaxID=6087 RepID=UPI0006414E81|nr:N-myc protein-like [Hydra vulgaris]